MSRSIVRLRRATRAGNVDVPSLRENFQTGPEKPKRIITIRGARLWLANVTHIVETHGE